VAAVAQPLPEQQQQAVDDQEDGGDHGRAEQAADEFLQHEADDDRGDGGDDDQAKDTPALLHHDLLGEADHAQKQHPPVAPEIGQQRDGGAQMQEHEEGQELGRVLIDAGAHQRGHDDRVAKAADREQLGGSLQDGDQDRLKHVHGVVPFWSWESGGWSGLTERVVA